MIARTKAEQAALFGAFKKGRLDEDRWYLEDVQYQRELVGYAAERDVLARCLVTVQYTPEYITDVQAACSRMAKGIEYFTRTEQRKTYELLDLQFQVAVEAGMKVAYVE